MIPPPLLIEPLLVLAEARMLHFQTSGGARFRRGYSEVKDAYRGPCPALSSLEKHNRE